MSFLSRIFGRTKIVIKLPPEIAPIVEAMKNAAANPAPTVAPLLASPDQVATPVDDFEKATKGVVLAGMDVALLRLGPLAAIVGPALKTLVADVLDKVFSDIEKKFIAKYNIQAPA